MTVDRTNPAYWWKTLRLGDVARVSAEAYECALGQADWKPAGLEHDKRQFMTQGAGALYGHDFAVIAATGGAILAASGAEISGETADALRLRIRTLLSSFVTAATLRVGTNHAGILALGFRDHEWTNNGALTAGSDVEITITGAPATADFVGWPVLLVAANGVHELTRISANGVGTITVEELVYSYGDTLATIIPCEWAVRGAYPATPLKFTRSPDGAGTIYEAPMTFNYADEPEELDPSAIPL